MKLIIAEKPSLARNVAGAIGGGKNKDGYIEAGEYLITWGFGHLLNLKSVEDYTGIKNWSEIPLPFIPESFEYKLKSDDGVDKQFKIIKELVDRKDVETIINYGDADREGQVIIDNIIQNTGSKKPVKRLWLPEQTEQTIRKQLNNLEDNNKYKNLYNEGLGRTCMDWLFGINLTVLISVKTGHSFNAGRVLIPIVKFIYDRDNEIKNFKPEKYYQSEGILEKDELQLTLSDSRKHDKAKADEITALWNSGKVKVEKIEKKEIEKTPGKLFSLSKLQSFLSKNYKLSFASSLKIIQGLYEAGYVTYPRTNTEYLAENEKDKVKELIEAYNEYPLIFKDSKKIFDNSKIESHSAIIPTVKKPSNLEGNEKIVYEAIRNRFIANFLNEKTTTKKVTVELKNNKDPESLFKLSGETVINEGFYKYEPKEFKDSLPDFTEGEEFKVDFKTKEKQTQPKKKVTEEELSNYLKNPFRKEDTSEDEEYKALLEGIEIGTEATRTGIIETCKKREYISQKASNYSIEALGEKLIENLDKLEINLYADKTVEFSKILKKIYKGEAKVEEAIDMTAEELKGIISKDIELEKIDRNELKEAIGECPVCKKTVYEGEKNFYCSDYKNCDFKLWKKTKRFSDELTMTKAKVKSLLSGKKAVFTLTGKENKKFEGYLKLEITEKDGKKYPNLKLDGFPEKKKK